MVQLHRQGTGREEKKSKVEAKQGTLWQGSARRGEDRERKGKAGHGKARERNAKKTM